MSARAAKHHSNGSSPIQRVKGPLDETQARKRVTDIQRARMHAGTAAACSEVGAAHVTVADIVARSGVSRRTFYEQFTDIEDCLIATAQHALDRVSVAVVRAFRETSRWRGGIRAALCELLVFLDREPHLGRLLIVESLSGGPRLLRCRSEVIGRLIDAVDQGRSEAKASAAATRLTAEGVVGAVLSVVYSRLSEGDGEPLTELAGPLMSMIVLPYLGAAAARAESARTQPVVPASDHPTVASLRSDPFKDAGMRLTYRTTCVLSAVAACPGASNRQIGAVAGISDQGQISKLLARLERIGLIANSSRGSHIKGEPNAWTLTEAGDQVQRRLQAPGVVHEDARA